MGKRVLEFELWRRYLGFRRQGSVWSRGKQATYECRGLTIENKHCTTMCSGSEACSYLRFIDSAYHSTLGLKVTKKKVDIRGSGSHPGLGSWVEMEGLPGR